MKIDYFLRLDMREAEGAVDTLENEGLLVLLMVI